MKSLDIYKKWDSNYVIDMIEDHYQLGSPTLRLSLVFIEVSNLEHTIYSKTAPSMNILIYRDEDKHLIIT